MVYFLMQEWCNSSFWSIFVSKLVHMVLIK